MPPLNDTTKEPGIQAALDELVVGWPGVTTGKMFGSRGCCANGVLYSASQDCRTAANVASLGPVGVAELIRVL